MKKIIAVLMALVMLFSISSVAVFAEEATNPGHGNTENDDQYEDAYTLLNFLRDLFERLNLLFEYIRTVFFPNV